MATQFHQGAPAPQSRMGGKCSCHAVSLAVVCFLNGLSESAGRDRGCRTNCLWDQVAFCGLGCIPHSFLWKLLQGGCSEASVGDQVPDLSSGQLSAFSAWQGTEEDCLWQVPRGAKSHHDCDMCLLGSSPQPPYPF